MKPGRRPRGLTTLATVLGLLALAAWAAASAQRAAVSELRAAASHLRAAQAFEAAQAGLDFTLALLQAGPVDAQCEPQAGGAWSLPQALEAGAVELACHQGEAVWVCGCPTPAAAAPAGAVPLSGASFRVEALRLGSPGPVRLHAFGQAPGGGGQATLSLLAAPEAGPPPLHWRPVPGSWRDF